MTSVRTDRLPFAVLVVVLKELVARQVAALLDDAREAPVVEIDFVLDAALAAEREPDALALDFDVRVAQRRQAERAIRSRVLVVADANQRLLEQLHDRREHLLARQALAAHVLGWSCRRMAGSACANPIMRWYFVSSRTSRHFG